MKPCLERETNKVLSKMCGEDRICRLHMNVNSDMKREFDISWRVNESGQLCPIEKMSGYQLFMLGLCFRIALSRVSKCTVKWEQLFIDEGFTSCDAKNLEKVPIFIKQLLDRYRTIVIVSHLEQIKDVVDKNIKINREKYFQISNIKYI